MNDLRIKMNKYSVWYPIGSRVLHLAPSTGAIWSLKRRRFITCATHNIYRYSYILWFHINMCNIPTHQRAFASHKVVALLVFMSCIIFLVLNLFSFVKKSSYILSVNRVVVNILKSRTYLWSRFVCRSMNNIPLSELQRTWFDDWQ